MTKNYVVSMYYKHLPLAVHFQTRSFLHILMPSAPSNRCVYNLSTPHITMFLLLSHHSTFCICLVTILN